MKIFDFETVDSLPALYHPGLDLLALSDLHLGLEGSMTYEGSYVPQFQLGEVKEDIETAVEETGASRVLLNGDLKHEFSTTRFSEEDEIREMAEHLTGLVEEVLAVKGNHDTFIEHILSDHGIGLEPYHSEQGVLFTHGHRPIERMEPGSYGTLVIGHEHPALALEDEIGVTEKVDCFLYGEMRNGKKIIVLPAFSKISGGSTVNRVPQGELLSPVLRNGVDVEKLEAVAVSKEVGLFKFPEIGKF